MKVFESIDGTIKEAGSSPFCRAAKVIDAGYTSGGAGFWASIQEVNGHGFLYGRIGDAKTYESIRQALLTKEDVLIILNSEKKDVESIQNNAAPLTNRHIQEY